MRDYQGILVNDLQDPRVRDKLAKIDYFLRDLSRGLGSIQKGLTPDGAQTPIGNISDDGFFFKLKGRPANQDAHGGTGSGGTLTLSSTLDSTKGFIYLGDAQQSAYDETNERLGINEPTPTAKVHITVSDVQGQSATPTTGSAGGLDWSNQGGAVSGAAALADTSNSTYIEWNAIANQNDTWQGNVTSGLTNPGGTSGYSIKITALATHATSNSRMLCDFKSSGGITFKSIALGGPNDTGHTNDATLNGVMTTYTFSLTAGEVALLDFGSQPWSYNLAFSGVIGVVGVYDIARIEIVLPPSGGGTSDTLQRWEAASTANELAFAVDGNSNQSLVFTGSRMAVSASAFAMTVNSPFASGIAISQDAIGTVGWLSASALSTLVEHRWQANGPYRVGSVVDGVWTAKKAMTLAYVRLYREKGGSSGNTQVTLVKNGTTVLSSDPTIAFNANAGASASADGTISTTTIAAGDWLAPSAVAVDVGLPRDAAWTLLMGAY